MGFSINIEDVSGETITKGVIKRVLLTPENTGRGPSGELTVTHYIIVDGSTLTLDKPKVEYQDFIISGSALFGGSYVHANTTIFVPTDREHSYTQAGESELRIISTTYSTPKPSHRWAKVRSGILGDSKDKQLMTEEYHALIGAQRFHALDIQTYEKEEHTNPEETAYFLRGKGEVLIGDIWHEVRPGSLVYSEEGETHAIKNTNEKGYPFQYYVMEYTEQEKMWSQRSYLKEKK
jgi:mannose-6-phosphate isomerase-like protein (cupin superfamily)